MGLVSSSVSSGRTRQAFQPCPRVLGAHRPCREVRQGPRLAGRAQQQFGQFTRQAPAGLSLDTADPHEEAAQLPEPLLHVPSRPPARAPSSVTPRDWLDHGMTVRPSLSRQGRPGTRLVRRRYLGILGGWLTPWKSDLTVWGVWAPGPPLQSLHACLHLRWGPSCHRGMGR